MCAKLIVRRCRCDAALRPGLEIESLHSESLPAEVEPWLASAQTPADKADEVRRLLDEDMRADLSGARPFVREGRRYFVQRTVAIACRKL